MNKENFELIRNIFDEVIKLPPEKRYIYLEKRCGENTELKKEIISLLKIYETENDFLEIRLTTPLTESEESSNSYIGKHIGSYLVEGIAGAGGMGIVYSGRRDDKQFKKKVAIKILQLGFNTDYLLKRFEIERQTLANLQHPNIASLLDGGETDDGLPYLVMEFIDGIPITEYCDQNKLNLTERLELFRTVCTAVQYAHQNLIVHRDIKPGNILVTKSGVPKLLDFGIAKLLDENQIEVSDGLTRTGLWHFTPEYASPEQIKGEKITTASDIYSLGVLLYQILTGQQPYKITSTSPVAISKIITEEKVVKPSEKLNESSSVTIQVKSKNLTGDIDNIVMKAMHKDPERRYVSVEQFSEDIRRHLAGRTVIAQKDTAGYRLSKFIQRHKIGFISSVAFILFLVASVIIISWQANVASEERDKARIENQKYERVNKFLQGMLSAVDPNELGRDVKVYDILEKAADDIETELKDQPEIEADIRRTLGNTLTNLGKYEQAKIQLEKSLELNEKIYGKVSKEAALCLHDLGLYYHWIGDLKLADSLYNVSLSIIQRPVEGNQQFKVTILNDYALLKSDLGNYNEAETMLREALKLTEMKYGREQREAASILNNLAITLHYLHKLEEAEKCYLEAQSIFTGLFGENHPEVATTYNNLAFVYSDKNEFDEAEKFFRKSYELKITLKGKDHPDVGLALNNLGVIQFKKGNYKKAEDYLTSAMEQLRKSLPEHHSWVGNIYFWLGKTQTERKNFTEAEKNLRKSLSIRKKIYPEGHHLIYTTEGELGTCLLRQNNLIESEKYLLSSYENGKNAVGMELPDIERFLQHLILLYEKKQETEKMLIYNENLKNLTKK